MLSAPRTRWTLALVGIALFMVTLDNLVVTTALPSIHASLGGGISTLEWTVNAYTLTYAVLLLTGAALGDRFGRRRIFVLGLFVFSLASAAAALAPSTGALIAARAVQGAGAAMVTPLTLTLLTDAVPDRAAASCSACGRRSPASASRSGRSSAARSSTASRGTGSSGSTSRSASSSRRSPRAIWSRATAPTASLTCRACCWPAAACWASSTASSAATSSAGRRRRSSRALAAGTALVIAFLVWETRDASPDAAAEVLPQPGVHRDQRRLAGHVLRDVRRRVPARAVLPGRPAPDAASVGLRTLAWTAMPMVVAPLAGLFSDRIGSRPFLVARPGAAGDRAAVDPPDHRPRTSPT